MDTWIHTYKNDPNIILLHTEDSVLLWAIERKEGMSSARSSMSGLFANILYHRDIIIVSSALAF